MLKLLKILLLPASILFGVVVRLRNFLFDKNIFKSAGVPVKVFSVGNVTVGGTGKTPTVIYLVKLLQRLGKIPGILSRGYGRETKGFKLVFDGSELFCNVNECGDEIILEVQNTNAPAAVCEDRVEGARKLLSKTEIDSLVLDDAFQHRKIKRDVDIVLLDQDFITGGSLLDSFPLPSGLLRESFAGLKRANVIIVNRKFAGKEKIPNRISNLLKGKKVFFAHYEIDGFYDVKNSKFLSSEYFVGQKSLVVSGIAKPDSFLDTLKSVEIDITNKLIFKDHKNYEIKDIQMIRKQFYETNAYSVITTEKDAVKLINYSKELDDIDIYFIRIKLVLENENEFEKFLKLNLN